MIRTLIFTFLYLLVAELLEFAVIPQFKAISAEQIDIILQLRLLAMAGILVGFLRGEMSGLWTALFAAGLFGFSQLPGYLGASIISFGLMAYLAGVLAHHLRFQSFLSRLFWIFLLLVGESFLQSLVRRVFWHYTSLDFTFYTLIALGLTALIGALLLGLTSPFLKRHQIFAR